MADNQSLLEMIASLLRPQGDPELQAYLRDPSSRPDIRSLPQQRRLPPANFIDHANRRIRPLPAMPAAGPSPRGDLPPARYVEAPRPAEAAPFPFMPEGGPLVARPPQPNSPDAYPDMMAYAAAPFRRQPDPRYAANMLSGPSAPPPLMDEAPRRGLEPPSAMAQSGPSLEDLAWAEAQARIRDKRPILKDPGQGYPYQRPNPYRR